MAGTISGGKKAAQKNKLTNPDFYRHIGAIGGKKSRGGGFASSKIGRDGLTGQERAKLAGSKGGKISKRTKSV